MTGEDTLWHRPSWLQENESDQQQRLEQVLHLGAQQDRQGSVRSALQASGGGSKTNDQNSAGDNQEF